MVQYASKTWATSHAVAVPEGAGGDEVGDETEEGVDGMKTWSTSNSVAVEEVGGGEAETEQKQARNTPKAPTAAKNLCAVY